MLSDLVEMTKRNELIVDIIKDLIHKESGRKLLVLSDRRNHLQTIKNLLDEDFTLYKNSELTDVKWTLTDQQSNKILDKLNKQPLKIFPKIP